MNEERDDAGNLPKIYSADDVAAMIMDEEPVKEDSPIEVEETESKASTDDVDILDELLADEDGADDNQEKEESTEDESEEPEEVDNTLHTVKIDGEEHEVSLTELKKGYGLQKSLTQKGQELAEERKKLDEETNAVAWAKAQPEARALLKQIQEAEEIITRGFAFDGNGEQVRLSQHNIEQTKKNVEEAQKKLTEMVKPPRLDDLQEAIPGMFNPDTAQEALKPFGDTLREFGYSEPEIMSQNDPRIFLMMKELHELRDLSSRVEKAKAKRAEKSAVVSKTTRAVKGDSPVKSKSGEAKPTNAELMKRVEAGESPAILFEDV